MSLRDDTNREDELRAQVSRLEQELAQVRDRLRQMEEIDRIHTDFAFAISHELRTPLTLISGYAQKLLMRWGITDEDRRRGMVEKINVSSHRLSRLIDDMLLVTDVERGILSLHVRSVAISSIVNEAIRELQDRHYAGLPRILVSGEPVSVLVDGFRLEQVLICLLDNAVKHSALDSTIEMSWRQEGACLLLQITDHGSGIDPADISRLFTRFGRLERVMGQSHGGIGLGLYIARLLVEAMNGTIAVESSQGAGSVFTVMLPMESAPEKDSESSSRPDVRPTTP